MGALPKESAVPPPLVAEASQLTTKTGVGAEAQTVKEAMP
jgi:hypothetical protein